MTGHFRFPLFVPLELVCGFFFGMDFLKSTVLWTKTPPAELLRVLMSFAAPCLVAATMAFGVWMQVLAAVLLVLLGSPVLGEIRLSVQTWVDQYLFREKYSYLAEIQRIGEDIFRFTNIPDLLQHLVNDLSTRAHLVWVGVWMHDLTESLYVLRQMSNDKAGYHLQPEAFSKAPFVGTDPLLQCLEKERRLVITEELALASDMDPGDPHRTLEGSAGRQLQELHFAAVFPVFIEEKLIGFIGFGPKEDFTMFHHADYTVLSELGKKAEHAIGQAYMLYEQSMMLSKLAHDTLNSLHALGMVLSTLDKRDDRPDQCGAEKTTGDCAQSKTNDRRLLDRFTRAGAPGDDAHAGYLANGTL